MFWCFKGVEPSESVLFRVLPMSSHLTGKRVIVTFPSYSEVMVKTILNFTWPDFILWYASNAFANGITSICGRTPTRTLKASAFSFS